MSGHVTGLSPTRICHPLPIFYSVAMAVISITVRSSCLKIVSSLYKRGSFQKFCILYNFSLKMNLFYKIHLLAFNVISIVLYHSGPTFGRNLYSCLDAFVVDSSDYSGHLIRHLLNASDSFPTEWFLQPTRL
jgi:hypothetical protein